MIDIELPPYDPPQAPKRDYLKDKIESINGDISVLLDNTQHLNDRLDLHQRLLEVAWKMDWLRSHLPDAAFEEYDRRMNEE